MTRLFLVRHGEPEAAWGGGDGDPGLSAAGLTQAELAAQTLAGLGPLAVLSSPMRRCQETAAPFARLIGRAAQLEPRVSEAPTPPGVGDRRAWLQQNFPRQGGAARSWDDLDTHLRDWREDVLSYVRAIETDTVAFSHFIAINVIAGAALGRDETIVCKPNYASITEIEVAPTGLRLVRHGAEMVVGEVR